MQLQYFLNSALPVSFRFRISLQLAFRVVCDSKSYFGFCLTRAQHCIAQQHCSQHCYCGSAPLFPGVCFDSKMRCKLDRITIQAWLDIFKIIFNFYSILACAAKNCTKFQQICLFVIPIAALYILGLKYHHVLLYSLLLW